MKQAIHPQYFDNTKVSCICGNSFVTGSTRENIHVELCYNCHPFYTGEQRFVDTASRIQKFEQKRETAKSFVVTKTKKLEEKKQKDNAPKTLREMLMQS